MNEQPDTLAYPIGQSLYINLTNRCTNACVFCLRDYPGDPVGYPLWLSHGEPQAQQVIDAMGDITPYREVVFCGYGEPMMRLETLLAVCRWIKPFQIPVRINTNGHANLIYQRDITPELEGLVDTVSISLNAPSPERYSQLCKPVYGEKAYEALLDFARKAARYVPHVVLSVVEGTLTGEEVEACRATAEGMGASFRIRSME